MTSDLYLYLIGVLVSSFTINFIINKFYNINKIKLIIFTILSPIIGVISTCIMSYIESGSFRGTSFFGAIFLMPIFVLLFSGLFKVKFNKMINLTAFLGMITSIILKFRCLHYDCCGGRKVNIWIEDKGYLRFPSQIAEMIFALFIFITLIILFIRKKDRKDLYPIMMIVYGIGRFILNSYRLIVPLFSFIGWGHIWSVVSVIIGVVWLIIIKMQEKKV